jgi:hypothetical protein
MVVGVDDPVTTEVQAQILALPSVRSIRMVNMQDG